jgi:hypothetical protein
MDEEFGPMLLALPRAHLAQGLDELSGRNRESEKEATGRRPIPLQIKFIKNRLERNIQGEVSPRSWAVLAPGFRCGRGDLHRQHNTPCVSELDGNPYTLG